MINQEEMKQLLAEEAVKLLQDGMSLGLGSGTTSTKFILELGKAVENGLKVKFAVATSNKSRDLAESFGIEVREIEEVAEIDLAVDGADRVNLDTGVCIKGWGGAAYLEKKVARKAKRFVVLVDETKVAESFEGERLPLEVRDELKVVVEQELNDLGYKYEFRDKMSDTGHLICDVIIEGVEPSKFAEEMLSIEGVIGTGLFEGLVSKVFLVKKDASVLKKEYS